MDNFWYGKRVLLTGGKGFLGNHAYRRLNELGADVVLSVRDLRKTDAARFNYAYYEPKIVIHLAAAVGGLKANIDNPGKFFYDNLMMGMNMIEGARDFGVEKFVQMGSACEYPADARIPMMEHTVWNGYPEPTNAPYGIAKRALLEMGDAYRQQYGTPVIHLLSTNLYGPGDNFDPETSHFIPALIRRCIEARKIDQPELEVWGTGEATRDFLYVEDAVDGILLAAEKFDGPGGVNLGSGEETKICNAATLIKGLTNYDGKLMWNTTKPEGQSRRFLSNYWAKRQFGFEAKTCLFDGLLKTIEWYEEQCAK